MQLTSVNIGSPEKTSLDKFRQVQTSSDKFRQVQTSLDTFRMIWLLLYCKLLFGLQLFNYGNKKKVWAISEKFRPILIGLGTSPWFRPLDHCLRECGKSKINSQSKDANYKLIEGSCYYFDDHFWAPSKLLKNQINTIYLFTIKELYQDSFEQS